MLEDVHSSGSHLHLSGAHVYIISAHVHIISAHAHVHFYVHFQSAHVHFLCSKCSSTSVASEATGIKRFFVLNAWVMCKKRKCLDHRSGFKHQIAAAPAAYNITFFSLLRFKYGTLTHEMPSSDSVVASALICQT